MPHAESEIWNRVQYQPARESEPDKGRRESLGCRLGNTLVYFYAGRFFFSRERLCLPQIMFLSQHGFPLDDVEHVSGMGAHVYVRHQDETYRVIISAKELN